MDNGSRMTQECHVRFCERLKVKFHGPTYLDGGFQELTRSWESILPILCIWHICYPDFLALRHLGVRGEKLCRSLRKCRA